MRRAAALVALAAAAVALAGCGIDRRTSAYRCESDTDCESDRRCEEGYCTIGPRDIADAAPGTPDAPIVRPPDAEPPDAFVCPGECTGGCLEDFTCVMDCSAEGSCIDPIVCPANLPCQVSCTGTGSCTGTIDCTQASSCDVTCGVDGACAGTITCPANDPCAVDCAAANSCAGGVECADSCSCEVLCTGADSCATPATCPPAPANKCVTGDGCNTTGHPSCNQC